MEGRQRRSFAEDYKRQAVDLVASSGRSIGSVAKELGLRDLCVLEESRAALRNVAGDYRAAAFRLERRRPAPVVRTLAFERRRRKSHAISMRLTEHPFRQQPTAAH
jgi:transposase-like protein